MLPKPGVCYRDVPEKQPAKEVQGRQRPVAPWYVAPKHQKALSSQGSSSHNCMSDTHRLGRALLLLWAESSFPLPSLELLLLPQPRQKHRGPRAPGQRRGFQLVCRDTSCPGWGHDAEYSPKRGISCQNAQDHFASQMGEKNFSSLSPA